MAKLTVTKQIEEIRNRAEFKRQNIRNRAKYALTRIQERALRAERALEVQTEARISKLIRKLEQE